MITMNFGTALSHLQAGRRIRRDSWNENVFYESVIEGNGFVLKRISAKGKSTHIKTMATADVMAMDWTTT